MKDKILIIAIGMSVLVHLFLFLPWTSWVSLFSNAQKVNSKKENYIEVEAFQIPKIMVRAKDVMGKDPLSRDNKDNPKTEQERIAFVREEIKKSYSAGMDLPSYAELLNKLIKYYFSPVVQGNNLKTKVEFTLSKSGKLLFLDIPYGESSLNYQFDIAALNAVTFSSNHFPPLPSCVGKESQLFRVMMVGKD